MQWLQDTSQNNADNLNTARCDASKHFRKRKKYLTAKIDEHETL